MKVFTNKLLLNDDTPGDNAEQQLLSKRTETWANSKGGKLNISPERLKKYFKKLNTGVGHDGIHSQLLQYASQDFCIYFIVFMNTCYTYC